MNSSISIIVSTYNRPDALRLVLLALDEQDVQNFEVIIADDGSGDETKQLVESLKSKVKYNLEHVWQEDVGFRAAMARNKGVALAKGDYLIFLDGDSIPRTSFVRKHRALAEHCYMVAGNRILLSPDFTKKVFKQHIPLHEWGVWQWFKNFCCGSVSRFLPVLSLGCFYMRYSKRAKWEGVKTCNLGMWREDFIAVNGLDESYQGWGYEDSDLAIRLIHKQVFHKDGRFAVPVFHLWHPENNRDRELTNYQKFKEVENSDRTLAVEGIDQYL